MFAETNCHWPSLREGRTWRDRLRKLSPQGYYTATAYNRHQDRTGAMSSFQWGGTAIAAFDNVARSAFKPHDCCYPHCLCQVYKADLFAFSSYSK